VNSTWGLVRIKEIAEIYDGPHATPHKTEHGPWFLSISSLRDGRLVLDESARLSEEDFAKWTRRVTPRHGDVLFSYETRLGEAAMMPEGVRACLGRRMALLRPRDGLVNPRFLLYAYLGPEFQAEIERRAVRGATVDRISLNGLGDWPIGVPDSLTQDAIAEVLGALDDKIDLAERIARTARALAAAVWSATSRRRSVGPVAETTLGRLVDEGALYFSDGYRTKQSELGRPGVPVLRVADVLDGRLVPSQKDCVLEELRVKFAHKVSQPGDVVLTTKGSIGRIAMIPGSMPEFVYSPQLCFFRVQPGSTLDRHWLHGWFRGPEFRERAAAVQHQTDMAPYINLVDLRGTRVTLPPPHVQRHIGELIAPLEDTAQAALYESEVLASLRGTLLPRLLLGELRVRDVEEIAEEAM
jgi:type I restriction enzyme S subunit